MEFNELIKQRRSVRAYKAEAIDSDVIRQIITEAQQAPSWKNSQTARYYVANTPEAIAKVREALPVFNQNSSEGAALIITSFVKDTSGFNAGTPENELGNKWGAYDCGLANSYLILAAKEKGYDTLIMGIRDAQALRDAFGIPKTEQIVSVIALGTADGQAAYRERKPVNDICRFL